MEILSIRDRGRSDTGDEGWAIHTDGSLPYREGLWFPSRQI